MNDKGHPKEKRQFGRRWLTCHAWIKINRRGEREACIVRNISERGALLEFHGAPPAANRFRLSVDNPAIDAECDVRHRTGTAVGVFFVQAAIDESMQSSLSANQLVLKLRSQGVCRADA